MLLAFFALATTVLPTQSQDFSAAAAEAAKRAKADVGGRYGVTFVDEKSVMFIIEAMQGCDSGNFAIGSTCDFILVISSSGRIERLLQGRPNAFAQCIFSHLQAPKTVAKPPSDHWPLHIRIYHGSPPHRPDPLIMYFADHAEARR
jgi:hypothetical protein